MRKQRRIIEKVSKTEKEKKQSQLMASINAEKIILENIKSKQKEEKDRIINLKSDIKNLDNIKLIKERDVEALKEVCKKRQEERKQLVKDIESLIKKRNDQEKLNNSDIESINTKMNRDKALLESQISSY